MKETATMPRGFGAAFKAVCLFYQCSEEEIELMRQCVREHPADAAQCYAALGLEIEAICGRQETGYVVSAADMVIEPNKGK